MLSSLLSPESSRGPDHGPDPEAHELIRVVICQRQPPFSFLDFGFAPGGMSATLLQSHHNIEGVGVTLDPFQRGMPFPEWLSMESRFKVELGDVCHMASYGETK